MADYRRRRKYFIDKNFQAKFIITFCLIVFISAAFILGVLLYLSGGSNTVAIENTRVTVKTTADFIFPIVLQTILITLGFSSIAAVFLTLLFSHKISGPLVRLTKEIDALEQGDFTRSFTTRGTDQLKKFSESLLKMSQTMDARFSELKKDCQVLCEFLESQFFDLSPEQKEKATELLNTIKQRMAYFKTSQ